MKLMMFGISSVARGYSVAGRTFRRVSWARYASEWRSASSATVAPVSFARSISLSSMSVKFWMWRTP